MFTQVYKPIQLTGIILCSLMLMLVLSSCKDSAVSGDKEQVNSTAEVANSASGKTIKVADASTAQDVYWTGQKSRTQEAIIARSYIDEQGAKQTEILYRGDQLENAFGVAVDLQDEMVYFTSNQNAFIGRAPLDGSGAVDTLYTAEDGIEAPAYVALNLLTDTIMWTDQGGILKGSLDGSAPVETVYSSSDGISRSIGVDLLLIGDLLYWTELADSEIVAGRAQGDISPQVLFEANDASPALSFLFDLEIDLFSGRLYVSDGDDENSSRILRGRLDGRDSLETIYEGSEEYAAASSLTIDHLGRNLYWSQTVGADFSGTILRGPLDGNGTPELVYDLRDFENVGIAQLYSISIPDPLGLKSKSAKEKQEEVVYLHF